MQSVQEEVTRRQAILKSRIYAAFAVAVFVPPAVSFSQSGAPITRAQVQAELIQLEQAGYHVGDGPDAIQAAETQVAGQNNAVGGAAASSSVSGAPAAVRPAYDGMKPIYFGQ